MKTIKVISFFLMTTLFVGCKKSETKKEDLTDAVIEETSMDMVPIESDIKFEQALKAYENDNKPEAIKYINEGIDAVEKESKNISGIHKENLDVAIEQLRNVAGKLDDNYDVSLERFKEAIANTEINVVHKYLSTDDVYVLTPKEKVKENNLNRALDHNLKSLETSNSKLQGDAKNEGEKLSEEGKKLKEDLETWTKRAEEHAKKTEEHFKKYQEEYIYRW